MTSFIQRVGAVVFAAVLVAGSRANGAGTTELGGDFRYRHEWIEKEGSGSDTRHRIRLRVGMTSEVNSNMSAQVRLATGSKAPNTSDQTLGDGFSSKDINLDRAFLDWTVPDVPGLDVLAGKMANPFLIGKGLVWDADVPPEGLAAKYGVRGVGVDWFATVGGFWVEERASGDDSMMYGGQLGGRRKGDGWGLLMGVGVFSYQNMEGFPVIVDSLKAYGNTTIPVTNAAAVAAGATGPTELLYANDFNEVEGFMEVSTSVAAVPVKCRGHYVVNTKADGEDTGYLVGFQVGKAHDPGSLQLDYDWRELKADAVVGAFADSNVWGGGTDGRGHRAYVTYQLAANWQLGVEYFHSQVGLDNSLDYDKFRAEVKTKF